MCDRRTLILALPLDPAAVLLALEQALGGRAIARDFVAELALTARREKAGGA